MRCFSHRCGICGFSFRWLGYVDVSVVHLVHRHLGVRRGVFYRYGFRPGQKRSERGTSVEETVDIFHACDDDLRVPVVPHLHAARILLGR